uniref:Uncharacterized protein n=1 Tax=Lepeophtheirus salmonis TaxID=72036 RepID=A0A0K2U1I9_LEPSM
MESRCLEESIRRRVNWIFLGTGGMDGCRFIYPIVPEERSIQMIMNEMTFRADPTPHFPPSAVSPPLYILKANTLEGENVTRTHKFI